MAPHDHGRPVAGGLLAGDIVRSRWSRCTALTHRQHPMGTRAIPVADGQALGSLAVHGRLAWSAVRSYKLLDPAHLALEGTVDGENLRVKLELFDAHRTLLVSRGFHWLNEAPFSR